MPKLIALITKQSHLSRAEFKAYYEAHHAPLVAELLPMIKRYTRSFMPEAPEIVGQGGELGFDVLTELWFEDEINLASFWERIREPEVAATIRADEANFLVAEKTVIYRVDETES